MIRSLLKLNLFGQEVYLTTTHISLLIICLALIIFAAIVRSKLKDTDGKPGALQNVAELLVEMLDNMVKNSMGSKGNPYRNYIGKLRRIRKTCENFRKRSKRNARHRRELVVCDPSLRLQLFYSINIIHKSASRFSYCGIIIPHFFHFVNK